MRTTRSAVALMALCRFGVVGCEGEPKQPLAPAASALASARPATAQSYQLRVETRGSKVSFTMEAPLERIHGELNDALSGEIFLDPTNLTKTRALIRVDLDELVLFQQRREDEKQEYGNRHKSDLQNEHARTWLQISDEGPAEERKKNAVALFSLTELTDASVRGLPELGGNLRKVIVSATGQLLLHGRKAKKTVELAIEVQLDDGRPKVVRVRTKKPLTVNLEQHDVRPRQAFSKLADKTLSALGAKVNKEPQVSLDFEARLVGTK